VLSKNTGITLPFLHPFLVGKPEGKRPHGRSRHRRRIILK